MRFNDHVTQAESRHKFKLNNGKERKKERERKKEKERKRKKERERKKERKKERDYGRG